MFRRLTCVLIVFLFTFPPLNAAAPLPIRRILLYKHGVAYVERSGNTAGVSEVVLEFKTSEMDDVLKSLTLLDRSMTNTRSRRPQLGGPCVGEVKGVHGVDRVGVCCASLSCGMGRIARKIRYNIV